MTLISSCDGQVDGCIDNHDEHHEIDEMERVREQLKTPTFAQR